jgi:putative Mg2+ transporter-C (MgtC) family protein
MDIPFEDMILRLLLALFLGSVIGLEREISQQSAGLRTHILVCLGSTVFTLVSILGGIPQAMLESEMANVRRIGDPTRISAQIVTGIGFIGGGAVLRHGTSVRGLTTAASLWMMASIGMLVGTGLYRVAFITTFLVFLVLFTIGHLERAFISKQLKTYNRLKLVITAKVSAGPTVQNWLEKHMDRAVEMSSSSNSDGESVTLTYIFDTKRVKVELSEFSLGINAIDGVLHSTISRYHDNPAPS